MEEPEKEVDLEDVGEPEAESSCEPVSERCLPASSAVLPLAVHVVQGLRWLKLRAATSQEANDLQVQMFLEYLKLQVGSGSRHTCTCSALGAVCTHVMLHLAPQ